MKVYAVGTLLINIPMRSFHDRVIQDSRLWYLFSSLQEAQECVIQNKSDLFEYYYNFALIEELTIRSTMDNVPEYYAPKQWWYQAHYDIATAKPFVTLTKAPALVENVVSFWAS